MKKIFFKICLFLLSLLLIGFLSGIIRSVFTDYDGGWWGGWLSCTTFYLIFIRDNK